MRRVVKSVMIVCFLASVFCFVQLGEATRRAEKEPIPEQPTLRAADSTNGAAPVPEIPLPASFQSPCADAVDHSLPLPTTVPPSQFVAYEQQILAFLKSGEYRTRLKWCVDKGVRDTGPYLKNIYYGSHPAVRIYYSPSVITWLTEGRQGPIPDGGMIIKEQFPPPAGRYAGLSDDQLPKVTGWTLMIKDDKGSADGWFWGDFWEEMTFDDDKVPFQYPNAGFGLACLNCHASAETESVFVALNNIKGFPGTPIAYEDDGSWKTHGLTTSYFSRRHAQPAIPIAIRETSADPDFLKVFDSISEVARSDVQTMPSETLDHIVSPGVGTPGFVSSTSCMHCHGGLTGKFGPVMFLPSSSAKPGVIDGANVSPYGEWRWSPMALSGRDPIFYSQLESELKYLSTLPSPAREQQTVATTNLCMSCHGVMGKRQLDTDSGGSGDFQLSFLQLTDRSAPNFKYGALARDGISCAVCHRTIEENYPAGVEPLEHFLENSISGRFRTGPGTRIYGPFEEVKTQPMGNALQMRPLFDPYMSTSRLCGSCHTIDLPVVDGAAGQRSIEQATYLEWLNSAFQTEFEVTRERGINLGRTCQQCHMPGDYHSEKKGIDIEQLEQKIAVIEDETYPDVEYRLPDEDITIPVRDNYRRHELVGINVLLLEMFSQFWDLLGVRRALPDTFVGNDYMTGSRTMLEDTIDNMVDQAQNKTAEVEISAVAASSHQIQANVTITNFAGHRFPSGVGFRRAFVEMLVRDKDGNLVWSSGRTNKLGIIVGGDGKILPSEFHTEYIDPMQRVQQHFQPHYEVIDSQDEVQIYEELTFDANGKFTTSFIRRNRNPKDNRLLPFGWSREGPDKSLNGRFLHATYPEGESVEHDPDYSGGEGLDRLTYLITLPNGVDPTKCKLQATLYYQSAPPRYLADRFKASPDGDATKRLYYLASNLKVVGTPIENWKLRIDSATAEVMAAPVACDSFCRRSARYYLLRLDRLPRGLVRIAATSEGAKVSTENVQAMRLALSGSRTIRERFNREFVALQVSMLASSPLGSATMGSALSCFDVDFVAVLLNDGTVLSPRSTFGDLVAAWNRVLVGRLDSDLVKLTGIFERLNGDDVLGGCE